MSPGERKILALLLEAKQQNEYGGSEDNEGSLHPGSVDWDLLIGRVTVILRTEFVFNAQ